MTDSLHSEIAAILIGHGDCRCSGCTLARIDSDQLDLLANTIRELHPERAQDVLDRGVGIVAVELLHALKGGGTA